MTSEISSYEKEATMADIEFLDAFREGFIVIEAYPSIGPVKNENGRIICQTNRENFEGIFSEWWGATQKKKEKYLRSLSHAIEEAIVSLPGADLVKSSDFLEDVAILMAARVIFGEEALKYCGALEDLKIIVCADPTRDWSQRGKLSPGTEALLNKDLAAGLSGATPSEILH